MDLYEAMKACQFEDCRVQMWGCQAVKADADPRGYDPTWNKYSPLDTGKHGIDTAQAFAAPEHAFAPAGPIPSDFSARLAPFWRWPYTNYGEVYGARGLMDEGLFPYANYRMLGGMPWQSIEVQ